MKTHLLCFALLGLTTACGGTVTASHYTQTCSQDNDCTPIYSGELCQVCGGCANAAINVSDRARYDADVKAISGSCPPRLGPPALCSACRAPAGAKCVANTCALAP
jgi:hypothetical protein